MNPHKKPVASGHARAKTKSTPSIKEKVATQGAWKPMGQRRQLAALQRSIERSLQWVVFESNGEPLWTKVRTTVEVLLTNEWRNGALHGASADQAFFVRCDMTTMTQYDIEHHQIIVLIGLALVKPAEFTTLRILQSTVG